jgi:hypothetical protein
MPKGKPAGMRCIQLTDGNLCRIFGEPERPVVCLRLRPSLEMCGVGADEAIAYLADLERTTLPS